MNDLLNLDYEAVARSLSNYVTSFVARSEARGAVVGVSGGVDSAATLALLAQALRDKVVALIMPDPAVTPSQDVDDALALVREYGVDYHYVDIGSIVASYARAIPLELSRRSLGNIRARIRMTLLYAYANELGYLVAGTGDRSEILIGYFTKYGDGGADFFPISCLYKTQVRHFARHLGVPERIAFKPSSPRLWPGHLAEEELGLRYEDIDLILYALFDLGLEPKEAARATGKSVDVVEKVLEMHRRSSHKRMLPAMPKPEEHVWRFRRSSA
ncbi:MAG: NAD+ synthase [Thermoproteota archaeon]